MPDIDIDFEYDKRKKIVKYLFKKYGKDHIAHIITFQKFGMKIAIRDICKVFDISIEETDKISKLVKKEYNYNYENSIKTNLIFEIYKKKYPYIFLHLKKIIGLPRQIGTHASGIILTKQRLQTIIPIKKGYNEIYQTQYSINCLEELGIIKIDILGLRNLTILHNIIDNINKEKEIKLNINYLPLDDKKTYQLLSKGDTKGIFQLESIGITKILIDIIPKKLEDIVLVLSLYRPSSNNSISLFIKRKKNLINITYIDNRLKEILESTYGIIIFQEQVMLIAQKVANFSLTKADLLIRSIIKKDLLNINKIKINFIKEAIKNNYIEKKAKEIWELIYKFSNYGFSRSHAISYSLLCYQIAYLKANYLLQFLSVLLTNAIGDKYKTNEYINFAKKNNLIIVSPSINNLYKKYCIFNNKIYLPLLIIKQIEFAFFNKIKEEYKINGKFINLYDFFIRLYKKGLNKKNYEALCFSGALDVFNINRISLFNNYQKIINYVELIKIKEENKKIIFDFSLIEKPELSIESDNKIICLEKEYKFLGFFLSNNILKYIRKKIEYKCKTVLIINLKLNLIFTNILVLVNNIKIINDKNNNKMAFLECLDESGEINIIAFYLIYNNYQNLLKINNILLLNIKLGIYNNKINGIIIRVKFIKII